MTNGKLCRRDFLRLAGLAALGTGAVIKDWSCGQLAFAKNRCDPRASPAPGIITDSLFDLLKIGPGPSSSHTMGPMRAANAFYKEIFELPENVRSQACAIEINLFGSLSATGKGHGTDRAIVAGLLGQTPETCPLDFLDGLLRDETTIYRIKLPNHYLELTKKDIFFQQEIHHFPFNNTMVMRLLSPEKVLLEKEYYSIGGGFIRWKGWKAPPKSPQ